MCNALSFHHVMKGMLSLASGEVLTKLVLCPLGLPDVLSRYNLGSTFPISKDLSHLHTEWPPKQPTRGRKGGRGCQRLTEIVINICGSKKEESIML